MESEEASLDTRVTVVLVIHNYTTSVNKKKAIENSNYFSSLLSGNFSDHNLKEHLINYDISVETFKNYINWIENTQREYCKSIYSHPEECLANVVNNYDNLLELLETSVVLMSDKLTLQLSHIITTNWLNPNRSLDIWKFAQDHGLFTLRDVAFEACLDRFSELPDQELIELSYEKFVELITNRNINDNQRIKSLVPEFLARNKDSIDPARKQLLIAALEKNNRPVYSQCLVSYKLDEAKKKLYGVYFLKEHELVELDFKEMFDFLDDKYEVAGRKIIGRRFSIYVIGGEKGLGTGRFITSIWRYCLISRTWYYVTKLPTARRHMIAEFIDQNLCLLGGVGSFRVKLSSVDILNIHTNEWQSGEPIPEEFTEIPPSCVMNKQIIYYLTQFNVFNFERNNWSKYGENRGSCYALAADPDHPEIYSFFPLSSNSTSPMGIWYNNRFMMVQESIVNVDNANYFTMYNPPRLSEGRVCHRHVLNKPLLVSFFYEDDKIFVEKADVEYGNYELIDSFNQQVDNITPSLFSYNLGCFNIINPETLYKKAAEQM